MDTYVKIDKIVSHDSSDVLAHGIPVGGYHLIGNFHWVDGAAWNIIVTDETIDVKYRDEQIENEEFKNELVKKIQEHGEEVKSLSEQTVSKINSQDESITA